MSTKEEQFEEDEDKRCILKVLEYYQEQSKRNRIEIAKLKNEIIALKKQIKK